MGDVRPCADQPTWEEDFEKVAVRPRKATKKDVLDAFSAATAAKDKATAAAKAKKAADALLDDDDETTSPGEQFEKVLNIAVESVQHELGLGLTEAIYRNALAIKMRYVGYTTSIEVPVPVVYSGETVGTIRADLVSYDKDGKHHIVELKVAAKITAAHVTQAKAYLKRSPDGSTAYVVNFGPEEVETYTI
jgi:GxxExxY protein